MLFDELKSYLNGKIAEDKDLNMTIGIKEQYPYGHKAQPPELLLAIMDNTELESATTFDGETVSNVSLQIIPMAHSMNIGGKKYNAQKCTTQEKEIVLFHILILLILYLR